MGVNRCECVFYQELDVFSDLGLWLTQQRPAVQDVRNKGGAADRVTWAVTPAFCCPHSPLLGAGSSLQ